MPVQVYARNGGRAEVAVTEVVLLAGTRYTSVLLDIRPTHVERDDLSFYAEPAVVNVAFLGERSTRFAYLNEVLREAGKDTSLKPVSLKPAGAFKCEPRPALEKVMPIVNRFHGLPQTNFDLSGLGDAQRICMAYQLHEQTNNGELEAFDKELADEMREIKRKAFSEGRVSARTLIVVKDPRSEPAEYALKDLLEGTETITLTKEVSIPV